MNVFTWFSSFTISDSVYWVFAFPAKVRVRVSGTVIQPLQQQHLVHLLHYDFRVCICFLTPAFWLYARYQHVHCKLFCVFECVCVCMCVLLESEPTCSLLSVKRGISHGYWKPENIFKVNICAWDCFRSKSEYPHETEFVNIYCNLW